MKTLPVTRRLIAVVLLQAQRCEKRLATAHELEQEGMPGAGLCYRMIATDCSAIAFNAALEMRNLGAFQ